MREAQKKSINGIEVTVTPFPAGEALKVQAMLLRLLGPALGQAFGSLNVPSGAKSLLEIKIEGPGLSAAIAEISEKLGEEEFLRILGRLLRGVQCVVTEKDGRSLVVEFADEKKFDTALDLAFGGQTMTVYLVVAFVLQVNYPDFFQGLLGTGGLLGRIISSKQVAEKDKDSLKDLAASET